MVSRRILSAVRLPFRHTGESFVLFYYTQLEFENQPLFEISQMVYNRARHETKARMGRGQRAGKSQFGANDMSAPKSATMERRAGDAKFPGAGAG